MIYKYLSIFPVFSPRSHLEPPGRRGPGTAGGHGATTGAARRGACAARGEGERCDGRARGGLHMYV